MTTLTLDADASGSSIRRFLHERPELTTLEEMLHPGEAAELLVLGHVIEATRPAVRRWLIVVTDQRLLCIRGSQLPGRRIIDIPLTTIRRVSEKSGLLGSTLTVVTAQGQLRLQMRRGTSAVVDDLLHSKLTGRPPTVVAASVASELSRPAERATRPAGAVDRTALLEEAVDRLETDMVRLQRQVEFLESLLDGRGRRSEAD